MNRVENIERYLRAQLAAERTTPSGLTSRHAKPFVTISRQAGTGGHALADVMIDVFSRQDDAATFGGWQVFDRTVCEIVAKDPRFARSMDSLIDEEYRSRANDIFHQWIRSTADQSLVMERVFLVVRSIAGMGKAIIVGRAGSHVTKGLPHGVSLRVIAPEEHRIRRTMETRGMSQKDARTFIKKRDADRSRLMKAHFGVDIEDALGYDLTVNLDTMDYEEVALTVTGLVGARAAELTEVAERS
jgi:Cytidylate kinase-like family